MENIEQLRIRHKEEIRVLQNSCSHASHKRMPYMWAPGHFGNDVEVCDNCGKTLKTYESMTTLGGDIVFSAVSETLASSDTVYTNIPNMPSVRA